MSRRPAIRALTIGITLLAISGPAHAELEISAKATKHVTCSGGVCAAKGANAVLNVTDLANMLASGDVTVQSGSLAQDIGVDAALSWTSAHVLTLDSFRGIAFNSPLTVAGEGGLRIDTNDGGSGGDFAFFRKGHIEFWSSSGGGLYVNSFHYFLLDSLKSFRHLLRGGSEGQHYAMMKSWHLRQIYTEPPLPDFDGTFEGLGNSISHLTIRDSTTGTGVGFFDGLGSFGVVRDVNFDSVDVAGTGSGQYVGAVSGDSITSTLQHVTVRGQISGGPGSIIGGLLGGGGGVIVNSWSTATIIAADNAVAGGVIAQSRHELGAWDVSGSFSTGAITNAGGTAGGIIGQAGYVADSYATGAITGTGSAPVGGLFGIRSAGSGGGIATSYSTAAVSSGSGAPVGGSIGEDDVAGSGISNAYWDLDTSGVSNPHQGAGNVPDDPGIAGLTDAQLKSGLPAGFDPKIWAINPKINNGYPYLINNPPPK